jgi:Tfp pilus assembly protein FimT
MELLIVIVLITIVASIALPRFAAYLRYLTGRTTTSRVVADLTMARTQAVREGATVSFRVQSASRYQVTVDDAAGTPARTIKTVDVEGPQRARVTLAPVGVRVAFDSRGMLRGDQESAVRVSTGNRVDSVSVSMVGRVYRAGN